jgi:hypothetical protein
MSAITSSLLIQKAILPSVLLMAVDDRILKYKHALPRSGRLEHFGMVNLCTRKWGLVISMTRFIHFGPLPQKLADGFEAAAKVNAALLLLQKTLMPPPDLPERRICTTRVGPPAMAKESGSHLRMERRLFSIGKPLRGIHRARAARWKTRYCCGTARSRF